MLQNPLDSHSSFDSLKTRLRKNMQQRGKVNEKIMGVFHEAYEQALNGENIVLSRPEKQRLVKQLIEEILTELISENK